MGITQKHHITIKFYTLLISLVALIILYPYLAQLPAGEKILHLALALIGITATYATSYHHQYFRIALILGIPFVALSIAHVFIQNDILYLINLIIGALFYLITALIILQHTLSNHKITNNTIAGGVSVYLLIGVFWSVVYTLANFLNPQSFFSTGPLSWPDFIYYSYATLTTLGYGDIAPLTPAVQSLSALEAVVGMLFLTILIARLVGSYIAQQTGKKK